MESIAIIIPTYRPGSYFDACLKSINNQTIRKEHYKVYICLNGDQHPFKAEVAHILQKFQFQYELFCTSQAGVSNARNILLEKSEENFIVFIDDDDIVSRNYLQELLTVTSIDVMGISNVANFLTETEQVTENYIGSAFKKIRSIETSKFKSRKFFSSPCCKMLHRDMIGDIRFDPRLSKGEDALFMAMISPRIIAVRKTSEDTTYYVRERPGSATRKKGSLLQDCFGLNYVCTQYIKLFVKRDYDKIFILTRIAATLIHYARMFKKSINAK